MWAYVCLTKVMGNVNYGTVFSIFYIWRDRWWQPPCHAAVSHMRHLARDLNTPRGTTTGGERAEREAESKAAAADLAPGRRVALLVSNAPDARLTDCAAVMSAGCECVLVPDMLEAREALERVNPTLLLVDGQTAWADEGAGYTQLASLLGAECPRVLLVSPDAPTELLETCSKAGLEDCILRPLAPEHLRDRLALLGGELPLPLRNPPLRRAPRSVLLAGGEQSSRQHLANLLEHCGYHVLHLPAEGERGLALLPPDAKADLVLLMADPSRPVDAGLIARLRERSRLLATGGKGTVAVLTERPGAVTVPGVRELDRRAPLQSVIQQLDALVERAHHELRAFERVPFFCPVEFREAGGSASGPWRCGFSFHISSGGIFVRTLHPFHSGAALEMRIHLTTTREEFHMTGVVAWANPYARKPSCSYPVGMGIQFLGIPLSRRLAQLIELCRSDQAST